MTFVRLQSQVLAIVLAGSLLFAAVVGAVSYRIAYLRSIDAGRDIVSELVGALEPTAAAGAYVRDSLLLKEAATGIARNKLVARVRIESSDGKPLAVVGALPASRAEGMQVRRALMSPFDASAQIGVLHVDIDMAALGVFARQQATFLAEICVALIAFVSALLSYAVARTISRPIVDVASQLGGIEPGSDASIALPPRHRRDELGQLISAANVLLASTAHALARERALRADVERMERQYRQIFDCTSAGIFVLDATGRLINGNPTIARVLGMPLDAIKDLSGESFFSRAFEDVDAARQMISEAIERGETVARDLELRQRDGRPRWVHCLISVYAPPAGAAGPADGQTLVEGVLYDVTERKRVEHEVRRQAEHDPLTGLLNRRGSEAAIDRLVAETAASGSECTLLGLDLDGFKSVNDSFGHEAGDIVLAVVASRMRAIVKRAADVVGRVGGDEFVVALSHVGPRDEYASRVAAELIAAICEPVELDGGRQACIGASIGLATFPLHGRDRRELALKADDSLYWTKRCGKRTYAFALAGPRPDGAPRFGPSDPVPEVRPQPDLVAG